MRTSQVSFLLGVIWPDFLATEPDLEPTEAGDDLESAEFDLEAYDQLSHREQLDLLGLEPDLHAALLASDGDYGALIEEAQDRGKRACIAICFKPGSKP